MKGKISIALVAFFMASMAMAGLKNTQPVDVTLESDGSGNALGDMVTARFDGGPDEFIGCGIRVYSDGAGGSFEFGFCQAEDADGDRAFCNTQDKALLQAMKSTSDFSFITFGWNSDGECTRIGFSTQSFYIPELTDGFAPPGGGRRGR